MTERQRLFIEEYMVDLNATQAAIRAGYKPSSAVSMGYKCLVNPSVRESIDKRLAEIAKRCGGSRERVLRELGKIAFYNPGGGADIVDAVTGKNASAEDTAVIAYLKVKSHTRGDEEVVEKEVKFADKLKALELLGKHYAMFQENVNVSGDVGVQIIDNIPRGKTD
ncbi:MAG: terminase small subunit [Clostridiales bacterium]|nr:terminase small subunit [Clostridiales bacterium]